MAVAISFFILTWISDAGTDSDGICSTAEFVTADANGSNNITITDALYIIEYLFLGGPEPVSPCLANGFISEEVFILKDLAKLVSVTNVDDPESTDPDDVYPTVVFSGCNVQVVNGLEATNGAPDNPCATGSSTAVNGLGNVIVGYNELRGTVPFCDSDGFLENSRSGSHNLVAGSRHNYSSFGGVVLGRTNEISAPFATALGGFENISTFLCTSIAGGTSNTADSAFAHVCGGRNNVASSDFSVVVGGGDATEGNIASGVYSVVVGGLQNEAEGAASVVVGGSENLSSGLKTVVSGGTNREASDEDDWVAGSLTEDE